MSTYLLKSWCSWPGFLLVACEGPGPIVRSQTAFLIFHGSQSTKCAGIQQEETLLSPNRPESCTKGPEKSHQVHVTTTALHTPHTGINNICPVFSIFHHRSLNMAKHTQTSSLLRSEKHSSRPSSDKPSFLNDYMRHLNPWNKSN